MAGAAVIIVLVVMAIFAPADRQAGSATRRTSSTTTRSIPTPRCPIHPHGGITRDFLLGVEPVNGRDLFSRVVYGSQISLLIAFLATMLSVVIGTVMGVVAGYFGGWVDTMISRIDGHLPGLPDPAVRDRARRRDPRRARSA